MSDTIEFTQLEKAQMNLEAIKNRIQEIEARQCAIPGEINELTGKLGLAVIGRLAGGVIHSEIEKLEKESGRLAKEAQSLAIPLQAAQAALAQAEEARELYGLLAAEAAEYPQRVYENLEAAYLALKKYVDLKQQAQAAAERAGRLAPVTIQDEPGIFIGLGAERAIVAARYALTSANVELLLKAGCSIE